MNDNNDLALFVDRLIANACPFALWLTPGSHTPEMLITDDQGIIYSEELSSLNGQEGFIFAPYAHSDDAPMVLLKPGTYVKGVSGIPDPDCMSCEQKESVRTRSVSPFVISRDAFIKDIKDTVEHIQHSRLAKVILSRVISFRRQDESVGELFLELLEQTPNAFVYLVNLPASSQGKGAAGLWMGATPEVLLRTQGNFLETVSLAGTQSRLPVYDYSWHTKEIEEQAYVSRYLLDLFYRFDIHPYVTRGPETLVSGRVAHLSTVFRFAAKKLASGLGDFITQLHPTPAVCGYPKEKAAKFIRKMEKHHRRYYTGYLGPWRMNGEVGLFVNLRCMEIQPRQYILYSGVGITGRSVPEDEWEETNKKASTLLSAIETVQNR